MFAKTLRTLALAAAVMAPLAAGTAQAEQQTVPPGATAVGAYVGPASRTPLAGNAPTNATSAQIFLELSGATGGLGQHG